MWSIYGNQNHKIETKIQVLGNKLSMSISLPLEHKQFYPLIYLIQGKILYTSNVTISIAN